MSHPFGPTPAMQLRHVAAVTVLALFAACGGSEPTPPGNNGPQVASVSVTPASPTIKVGETRQMVATAVDINGNSVSGSVSWSSSRTDVATITSGGMVTGVAAGTSAITATVGGVAGSQVATVEEDQCEQPTTIALAPGASATYQPGECLLLPAGVSGDYYRIAVARPTQSESPNDVVDVTVKVTGLSAQQSAPVRAASAASEPRSLTLPGGPRIDGTKIIEKRPMKEATARFHMRMFEREVRERGPGPDGLAPNRPVLGARLLADPPASISLTSQFSCSASPVPQTLLAFNDDIAFYQDSTERSAKPISASAAQMMVDYYDAHVKDMIPQYWGPVTDIDGNGRIIVTTAPALGDTVVAAIFTGDLRTSGSCAAGNKAEVIFFNVDVVREIDEPDPGFLALPTLAHEIKHLVSIYNRFAAGMGVPPLWIEEGLAEISGVMSSRIAWAATGGPALGAEVTFDNLIATLCASNPCDFTKEIWGVVDALANSIVQLSTHPNSLVTNPTGANEFHSIYASGWHYHRFLGDAYGNASTPMADAPFFKSLVDSTSAHGFAATQAATGKTFDQLFEELLVAMSFHKTPAPQPARQFSTWDMFSATQIFASPAVLAPPGAYPWPRTVNAAGDQLWAPFTSKTWTTKVGPSGISFYDFRSAGSGGGLQVEITAASPAKVYVTRIQ